MVGRCVSARVGVAVCDSVVKYTLEVTGSVRISARVRSSRHVAGYPAQFLQMRDWGRLMTLVCFCDRRLHAKPNRYDIIAATSMSIKAPSHNCSGNTNLQGIANTCRVYTRRTTPG